MRAFVPLPTASERLANVIAASEAAITHLAANNPLGALFHARKAKIQLDAAIARLRADEETRKAQQFGGDAR